MQPNRFVYTSVIFQKDSSLAKHHASMCLQRENKQTNFQNKINDLLINTKVSLRPHALEKSLEHSSKQQTALKNLIDKSLRLSHKYSPNATFNNRLKRKPKFIPSQVIQNSLDKYFSKQKQITIANRMSQVTLIKDSKMRFTPQLSRYDKSDYEKNICFVNNFYTRRYRNKERKVECSHRSHQKRIPQLRSTNTSQLKKSVKEGLWLEPWQQGKQPEYYSYYSFNA